MPDIPQVVTRAPADGWLLLKEHDCPLRSQHRSPPSLFAFDDWAKELAKTHRQMRCAGCHRWAVWVPFGGSAIINGIHGQVIRAGSSEGRDA